MTTKSEVLTRKVMEGRGLTQPERRLIVEALRALDAGGQESVRGMRMSKDGLRVEENISIPHAVPSPVSEVEALLRSDYSHLMLQEKALELARRLDEEKKARADAISIADAAQERAEELQSDCVRLNNEKMDAIEARIAAEQRVKELEQKPTWDKMIADLRAVVAELPGNRAAAPGAEEGLPNRTGGNDQSTQNTPDH